MNKFRKQALRQLGFVSKFFMENPSLMFEETVDIALWHRFCDRNPEAARYGSWSTLKGKRTLLFNQGILP